MTEHNREATDRSF